MYHQALRIIDLLYQDSGNLKKMIKMQKILGGVKK